MNITNIINSFFYVSIIEYAKYDVLSDFRINQIVKYTRLYVELSLDSLDYLDN